MTVWAVSTGGCAPRQHAGPNDAYRDPRVGAEVWNHYFEDNGRGEIYQQRQTILRLAAVKPGMRVADVGAGTGLFSMMLSDSVGPEGIVYAEEVVDRFSRYIAERAYRERRPNVVSVLGTERSVGLAPSSIDLAFLCDVYHHFESPQDMLASIRQSLRPGGRVLVVDFKREPGRSADWVFDHVRAAQDVVAREFGQAGFVPMPADQPLRDSYVLRFQRSETSIPGAAARAPRD
jgi:predicted methyltransferase